MRELPTIVFLFLLLLGACDQKADSNPAAEGFNAAASDPAAIDLADQVMVSMGGRKAWDDTKVIAWSFFGKRHLIWDKHTGDVRITSPGDSTIYLYNIFDDTGQVMVKDTVIEDPTNKQELLKKARRFWINDSYWLVMPFKLKDSGVTLAHLGEGKMKDEKSAHILQLSFENVGVTPNNRYHVWIDKADHLIKQWAFYRELDQEDPNYIRPWDNYQKYGDILLSADRSDDGGPKDVRVLESIDPTVFTDWKEPNIVTESSI
ncbi:MAG: hypothetical protein HKN87_11420 [Saprospiraceae bacterium]|nr:hypothetical protein [Saprospiraceae bacterium]